MLTSELIFFRDSENQEWSLKRTSSFTGARLKTEDEYRNRAARCALCLISELLSTPYFTQRRLFYFVAKCSNLRKLLRFVLLLRGKKIPIRLTRREKEIERTAKKEQGFTRIPCELRYKFHPNTTGQRSLHLLIVSANSSALYFAAKF